MALDKGAKVTRLERTTGGDVRPALEAAGAIMVAQAQRAFREQKKGRFRWPERQTPNLAGILSDLARGVTPPARRSQGRPANVDTGKLRNSITFRVSGNAVEVGTTVSYATKVQQGGASTFPITDRVREGLVRLALDKPEAFPIEFAEQLAERGSVTITSRPRPFLLVTGPDEREVAEAIEAALAAIVRG